MDNNDKLVIQRQPMQLITTAADKINMTIGCKYLSGNNFVIIDLNDLWKVVSRQVFEYYI